MIQDQTDIKMSFQGINEPQAQPQGGSVPPVSGTRGTVSSQDNFASSASSFEKLSDIDRMRAACARLKLSMGTMGRAQSPVAQSISVTGVVVPQDLGIPVSSRQDGAVQSGPLAKLLVRQPALSVEERGSAAEPITELYSTPKQLAILANLPDVPGLKLEDITLSGIVSVKPKQMADTSIEVSHKLGLPYDLRKAACKVQFGGKASLVLDSVYAQAQEALQLIVGDTTLRATTSLVSQHALGLIERSAKDLRLLYFLAVLTCLECQDTATGPFDALRALPRSMVKRTGLAPNLHSLVHPTHDVMLDGFATQTNGPVFLACVAHAYNTRSLPGGTGRWFGREISCILVVPRGHQVIQNNFASAQTLLMQLVEFACETCTTVDYIEAFKYALMLHRMPVLPANWTFPWAHPRFVSPVFRVRADFTRSQPISAFVGETRLSVLATLQSNCLHEQVYGLIETYCRQVAFADVGVDVVCTAYLNNPRYIEHLVHDGLAHTLAAFGLTDHLIARNMCRSLERMEEAPGVGATTVLGLAVRGTVAGLLVTPHMAGLAAQWYRGALMSDGVLSKLDAAEIKASGSIFPLVTGVVDLDMGDFTSMSRAIRNNIGYDVAVFENRYGAEAAFVYRQVGLKYNGYESYSYDDGDILPLQSRPNRGVNPGNIDSGYEQGGSEHLYMRNLAANSGSLRGSNKVPDGWAMGTSSGEFKASNVREKPNSYSQAAAVAKGMEDYGVGELKDENPELPLFVSGSPQAFVAGGKNEVFASVDGRELAKIKRKKATIEDDPQSESAAAPLDDEEPVGRGEDVKAELEYKTADIDAFMSQMSDKRTATGRYGPAGEFRTGLDRLEVTLTDLIRNEIDTIPYVQVFSLYADLWFARVKGEAVIGSNVSIISCTDDEYVYFIGTGKDLNFFADALEYFAEQIEEDDIQYLDVEELRDKLASMPGRPPDNGS